MFSSCSFSGSPSFIEGWCPGSTAPIFSQSSSFATAPIIYLNDRSFSISCWVKPTKLRNEGNSIFNDWRVPWQFQLTIESQVIALGRHSTNSAYIWLGVYATKKVSLQTWTHVVITWDHEKGSVLIYIDGEKVGMKTISPRETSFYQPTGKPYQIGNDGHPQDHQFYGSVMDLCVWHGIIDG